MKQRLNWMLLMLLIALVAFAGCSDDDDPVTPPATTTNFDVVAKAVEDVISQSAVTPAVISAFDLYTAQNSKAPVYTVIDIRGETDYNNGHIPGAVHSSLGTLLTDLTDGTIPTGKPYVVTCYTGQSAGHAKVAMSMMGYDVKSLLFGMSSWSPNVTGGNWSAEGKCADNLTTPETTNNNGSLVEYDYPVLEGNASTIVAERVAAMLARGFKATSYSAIQNDLGDYFLLNYWGEADYLGTGDYGTTGHIPGAFQFTPYTSLMRSAMLKNLPTDKQIVVYCWTGQHSSQITAALNMLGYDALSLAQGANNLMHTALTGHKWSAAQVKDYALEQ